MAMKLSEREILKRYRSASERFADVVASYWEAKAGLLPLTLPVPLISQEEMLAAVRRAFEVCPDAAVVVLDNHSLAANDPRRTDGSLVPSPDERSMPSFIDRAMARLGATSMYCYLPGAQVFAPDLWLRCRELIAPLIARVGLPANRIEMDAFWGRYDETPSRIHKDSANITYVVSGKKKLLVWPHDSFAHLREVKEQKPRFLTNMFLGEAARLSDYRASAISLEGQEGELMYWPSDHWHIGVGQGEPVQTLTIAFYLCDDVSNDLKDAMKRIHPSEKWQYTNFTLPVCFGADGRTVTAPPERSRSLARLMELFHASLSTQAEITSRDWTRRVTAAGFTRVPPLEPLTSLPEGELVGDADFPVLVWDSALSLHVYCNGHGEMFGPSDPAILALVDLTNTGKRFRVADFIAVALRCSPRGADETDVREEAERLLIFLIRARGVYLCD